MPKTDRLGPIARTTTVFSVVPPVIVKPPIRTLSPVNTSSRVEMLRRSPGDGVGEGDTDGDGEGVGEGDGDGVGVGLGSPLLTPKTTKFGFPVLAKVVLVPSGVTWKMNPPVGSAA